MIIVVVDAESGALSVYSKAMEIETTNIATIDIFENIHCESIVLCMQIYMKSKRNDLHENDAHKPAKGYNPDNSVAMV